MKRIIAGRDEKLLRGLGPLLVALCVAVPALGADPAPVAPLDCVLEPYEVVEVSSAVQGVINEIHVDRNDMVERGQLLVELDSDVERTQVELARARAGLETSIELRETELAFNVRNERRLEKLYQTDTISLHIKDEAETDTQRTRLQLRGARDDKRLAELELARAEAVLALRSMHSPISGVVVVRNRVAGEFVEDQSILRVAQLDPLRVEVIVPVDMFGSITEGMRVEVFPEHSDQESRFATVTMVDRMIDPASGTFDVRAELPNPDLAIPSGLRCMVQFINDPNPNEAVADQSVAEPQKEPLQQEDHSSLDVLEEIELPAVSHMALLDTTDDANDFADTTMAEVALCEGPTPNATTRYTVLADPAQNSLETRELVDSLRQKEVQDLHVIAQGVNRGQVSLGVYKKLGNAEKRQAKVSSHGFVVHLDPQTRRIENPDCVNNGHIAGTAP